MAYNYINPYYHPNYFNALMQQQQMQQQAQQQAIRVILVSNEEEAKATPADLNGNPIFFYNKSMNKIYLKQINPQTGAAPLQVYNAEQPIAQDNIKTQPDEMMRYQTLLDGINSIHRLLQQNTISTQPPILDEEEKPKKASK